MNIRINPEEVFRYTAAASLSHDADWQWQVEKAIAETEAHISPRFCYRFFSVQPEKNGICLPQTTLFLPGEDIKKHLCHAEECILMAATLGSGTEQLIRRAMAISMTQGLLIDACMDAAIEALCDKVCEEIVTKLDATKSLTDRYSPGYGDLPLTIQNQFLTTLDAQKQIGLHVSEALILTPKKSVTAVLGIVDKSEDKKRSSCKTCNLRETCQYKTCRKDETE